MDNFFKKHCTPEWESFLKFHMQEITVKKDTFIFRCKHKTKGIYIIKSGNVKISYTQFNGNRRIIRFASNGDILGHRGLGDSWEYTVAAQTYTPAILEFIPLDIFNIVAKSSTQFLFNFMMFYANELRKSDLRVRNTPVKNLLAEALMYNIDVFGFEEKSKTKLAFTIPRKDLANYIGTTYETIVRKLAELSRENIIKVEGKSIHILDIEELSSLTNPEILVI